MIPAVFNRGDEVYVFFPADHEKGLNGKHIKCVVLELKAQDAGGVFAGPRYAVQTREADKDREIEEGNVLGDVPQSLMKSHLPVE